MLHRLKVPYVSVVLLLGSAVCLGATAWLVLSSGALVYFLTFHTPLHLQLVSVSPAYSQPALPSFKVQPEISRANLSAGDTEAIHITVMPNQTVSGYLEVWVRGPNNREVFKYPTDLDTAQPLQFTAGRQQVLDEAYLLPTTAPSGKYTVSASIVSVNQQVDYYNAHNFASFEVL